MVFLLTLSLTHLDLLQILENVLYFPYCNYILK